MDLIKQPCEFGVGVEDISVVSHWPVHVNLIGISALVGIVLCRRSLNSIFCRAARHQKQFPDVWPLQPYRKDLLAVVDSITDQLIQLDDILIWLRVGSNNRNTVKFQLIQAFLRNQLRQCMKILQVIAHALIELVIILLYSRTEHTQIADNASILVSFQLSVYLHLRRFCLLLKNFLWNADQIGYS